MDEPWRGRRLFRELMDEIFGPFLFYLDFALSLLPNVASSGSYKSSELYGDRRR